jgi:PAS domain S-box-containing protein
MAEDIALKAYILDHIGEMVVIHDFDGNIIYANQAWCNVFKMSKHEIMCQNIMDLIAIQDEERFFQYLKTIRLNKRMCFDWDFLDRKNSKVYVEIISQVIPINSEKAVLSTVRDITCQRCYEIKLKQLVEKYNLMLETTTDWIFDIQEDFTFSYSNQQVRRLLGWTVEEILGGKISSVLGKGKYNKIVEILHNIKDTPKEKLGSITFKHFAQHRNGDAILLETVLSPHWQEENGLQVLFLRGISSEA